MPARPVARSVGRGIPRSVIVKPGTPAIIYTYATWNPADKDADLTLSNGNLSWTTGVAEFASARANMGKATGKWYWETNEVEGVGGTYAFGGIAQNTFAMTNNWVGSTPDTISAPFPMALNLGEVYRNSGIIATIAGVPALTAHTIRHKLDMTAGTYELAVLGGAFTQVATGLTGTWFPACTTRFVAGAGVGTANFGASAFVYSVPSGFNAGVYTTS